MAPVLLFLLLSSAAAAADLGAVDHVSVTRGEVTIDVLAQGEGPAIVILPSLGRSGNDYDAVSRILAADGFRVLRPQPASATVGGPMENLTMHDLAADVASVIAHEHAAPAVVVGHAFGNFVARQVAADRPDLVSGVVLAAGSAGKVPPRSKELPIGPEMRQAIDGPSETSLPEKKRIEYLRIAFFAPGHDPSVWLGGWNTAVHHMESHARERPPVTTISPAAKRRSSISRPSTIRSHRGALPVSSSRCWEIG